MLWINDSHVFILSTLIHGKVDLIPMQDQIIWMMAVNKYILVQILANSADKGTTPVLTWLKLLAASQISVSINRSGTTSNFR